MSIYAVVGADGIVSNMVVAEEAMNIDGLWVCVDGLSPAPGIGWSYDGSAFAPPPAPPAPAPQPPIITKIAMITRFTDDEFTGVLAASKTDVEVEGWYARFMAASVINLEDQRTIDGINMLVSKNLLTPARATAILTDPVQPSERP